jgi:hypothetical protein
VVGDLPASRRAAGGELALAGMFTSNDPSLYVVIKVMKGNSRLSREIDQR